MKTKSLMALLIATTMLATGAQTFGQTKGVGGGDGNVQLPAVQMASDTFFASLYAYQHAQYQANYWRPMQPYHPNAYQASVYWQISANSQYQSMSKLYLVWSALEQGNVTPTTYLLALEAEADSLNAGWFAMAAAATTSSNFWDHPAFLAAANAYEKIGLLIPDLPMP
jgi:hypothetical protein